MDTGSWLALAEAPPQETCPVIGQDSCCQARELEGMHVCTDVGAGMKVCVLMQAMLYIHQVFDYFLGSIYQIPTVYLGLH